MLDLRWVLVFPVMEETHLVRLVQMNLEDTIIIQVAAIVREEVSQYNMIGDWVVEIEEILADPKQDHMEILVLFLVHQVAHHQALEATVHRVAQLVAFLDLQVHHQLVM